MFRSFLVVLFGILFLSVSAQSGVRFQNMDLEAALAQAKVERKPIFIDAWATWCGPCKAMNRNTFPVPEVGEVFNKEFINLKIDVDENPAFATQYNISAMPTLLFIDHMGGIIHRVLGYRGPKELLAEARRALDPARNVALLKLEYEAGSRDERVLLNYAEYLKTNGDNYRPVMDRYFANQSDKSLYKDEQNWEAIKEYTFDIDSREFRYLLKKQKKFVKAYGQKEVQQKIYDVLRKNTIAAALAEQPGRYQECLRIANELKDGGRTAAQLRMSWAAANRDWADYGYKATHFFEEYGSTDPEELSRAAKHFYDHIDEEDQLGEALNWIRQAVALENTYIHNHLYAALLYKLGFSSDAKRVANQAISIAELSGEDHRKTDRLLDLIRGDR